jgi:hypothetical protein
MTSEQAIHPLALTNPGPPIGVLEARAQKPTLSFHQASTRVLAGVKFLSQPAT